MHTTDANEPLASIEQMPLSAAAEMLGVPYQETLPKGQVVPQFLELVPIAHARRHAVLVSEGHDGIRVVLGHAASFPQVDVIGRLLNRPVQAQFAPPELVVNAVNRAYESREARTSQVLAAIPIVADPLRSLSREDLLDGDRRAPVVQLVNQLLFEAAQTRASDIHVQPAENRLVVRYRIDGILHDAHQIPRELFDEVVSRLKVLGGMNVAEKRLPQDGRATVTIGDRVIDLRLASLPTSHGERIVVRLLDKSARVYRLPELGYPTETLDRLNHLIHRDHGMFLVTGPTGSGKSTTLYAALQEIDSQQLNVVTIEDPIEYQLDGVSQSQVNLKKGFTFASGLRCVLRQDPDIIMVGEIRDHETAEMAVQSSLTGHMVFSTLHTNDATSAVTRLLDLGIEPFLVSSCLVGVLAQRLVRRTCPQCQTREPRPGDSLDRPCLNCRGTGFRGRFAISELLVVTDPIRRLIQDREPANSILRIAIHEGLRPLREDGLLRVAAGWTTATEIDRVTVNDTLSAVAAT